MSSKVNVEVKETDCSELIKGNCKCPLIATSNESPPNEPIEIKPTTPKVKWWQFWKWHKIRKINKQRMQECMDQFIKHFGTAEENPYFNETMEKIKILESFDIPILIHRGIS